MLQRTMMLALIIFFMAIFFSILSIGQTQLLSFYNVVGNLRGTLNKHKINVSCKTINVSKYIRYVQKIVTDKLHVNITLDNIQVKNLGIVNNSSNLCEMDTYVVVKPLGKYEIVLEINVTEDNVTSYSIAFKPNITHLEKISKEVNSISKMVKKQLINSKYVRELLQRINVLSCIPKDIRKHITIDEIVDAIIHEAKKGSISFNLFMRGKNVGSVASYAIMTVFEKIVVNGNISIIPYYKYLKLLKTGHKYVCKEEIHLQFPLYINSSRIVIGCPEVERFPLCIANIRSSPPVIKTRR